ncbi:uncharacterized protein [Diadema setosum]|uniref:uncharacterized protein n=1 Tax=Diadema setosum TaxID=31175 RepID=UPI003B3BD877
MTATEAQKQKYEKAFNLFDKDSSGKISTSELKSLLESIGQVVSDEDISSLLDSVKDRDGDRTTLNLEEFTDLVESRVAGLNKSVLFALSELDTNKDGYVDPNELLKSLKVKLAGKMIDEKIKDICDKMMAQADKDKDGRISYKEFAAMM